MAAATSRRMRPDRSAGRAPPPGGRRRWWWPSMSSWHGTVPGAAWRVIARTGDLPCAARRRRVILRDDTPIVCAVETWGRLVTRLRGMAPYRADLLLAAVLLAEMTIEIAFMPGPGQTRAWVWLFCLGEAAGVALRRRATL